MTDMLDIDACKAAKVDSYNLPNGATALCLPGGKMVAYRLVGGVSTIGWNWLHKGFRKVSKKVKRKG